MAAGRRLVSLLRKAIPTSSSNKLSRSISSSSWSSSSSSRSSTDYSDNEDNFSASSTAPSDVPQGCFAVYVGSDRRRFVVKMRHLGHPLFRALLQKSAEEFGFEQAGVLTIPCDSVLFEHVLWLLNNKSSKARSLEIDELLSFYSSP